MFVAGSNDIWKNSKAHLVRSAEAELALKQKKTQQQPLNNKNTNTLKNKNKTENTTKKPTAESSSSSQNNTRKDFINYHIFLDSIESQVQKRLVKQLKILGATVEPFFSIRCTHLITSKSETAGNLKVLDQENIPPTSTTSAGSNNNKTNQSINNNKQKNQSVDQSKDDIVDKAKRMNMIVWRLNYATHLIKTLLDPSQSKRPQKGKKMLDQVYKDDKRFGPSTSVNDHAQRPHFVKFTGNYLMVEDVTKIYRPPIIRVYSTEPVDKSAGDFPWPYLKKIPGYKSPFSKMPPTTTTSAETKATKQDDIKKEEGENGEKKNEDNQRQETVVVAEEEKEKGDDVAQTLAGPAMITNATDNNNKSATEASPAAAITAPSVASESPLPATPITIRGGGVDSLLRASGFQPSIPNTQSTLRCNSGLVDKQSRPLPTDNNNNMNKRVIENLSKKEAYLSQQQQRKQQKQNETKHELYARPKQPDNEYLYCENCNKRFTDFEEHLNSESHLVFIRDQNNYKKLDELLEATRRQYKGPIPEHLRGSCDPAIDGHNIKFQTVNKRNRNDFAVDMTDIQAPHNKMLRYTDKVATDTALHHPIRIEELNNNEPTGWEKHYDVFLS